MTAQNKATIKSYFETGDRPTQAQFGDFIDSYLDVGTVSGGTNGTLISVSGNVSGVNGVSGRILTSNGAAVAPSFKATPTIFDIRNYGAVCDGITNDATAIQAAIAAASSNGGGIVVISGRSAITTGLTVQSTGVSIIGQGRNSTGLICSSTAFDAITIGGISTSIFRCNVQNMFIQGGRSAVKISYNTSGCHMEDLYITSGITAITIQGDYTTNPIRDATNHFINRVEAENMSGNIFYLLECGDNYLNDIITPSSQATAYGLVIDSGVSAAYISHCNFLGNKGGVLISDNNGISPNPSGLPTPPHQIYFYQVQGDTCNDFGIQIQRGYQITFVDCWGSGTIAGPGWNLGDGTANLEQICLIGCRALGNSQDGFRWVSGNTHLNSQMVGCHAISNGTSGSNTYDGISVQNTITGLVIQGCNSYSTSRMGLNNFQRYGINLISGAISGVTITGNNLANNLTAGIANGSTGTDIFITDNIGFNDQAFGVVPSMPASTVNLVNPYGRDMLLYITGGTVTAIKVDTLTIAVNTPIVFPLKATHEVSITYSSAPSWTWIGM